MKKTQMEVIDLIVPAEEMVRPQNPAKRRKKAKRAARVERADYQVLTENNCDLIVEKYKTGELAGKLILSPSRNEFCFRNAKDKRLVLNHVNVSRFFKEAWGEGGTGLVGIPEEILWMEDLSFSGCYNSCIKQLRMTRKQWGII